MLDSVNVYLLEFCTVRPNSAMQSAKVTIDAV